MNYRNPKFNAIGTIDCEIEHPIYGWIPFTASPDDCEAIGREIYVEALAANPAAYLPPPPPEAEVLIAEAKIKRQSAYAVEADPLFFKSQRGEATHQEWIDKIAEIQNRFPYPEAGGS